MLIYCDLAAVPKVQKIGIAASDVVAVERKSQTPVSTLTNHSETLRQITGLSHLNGGSALAVQITVQYLHTHQLLSILRYSTSCHQGV